MTYPLQRYGKHLMSLASLGQFGCLVVWVGSAIGIVFATSAPAARFQARALNSPEAFLLVAFATLVLVTQLWALARLRQIGKLLHDGATVSHEMADAWHRLGRGIIAAGAAALIPVRPELAAGGSLNIEMSLSPQGIFFLTIAGLCIFSVSRILREAAALQDENRSIV
jgi:hypothetical protein